MFFTFCKAMEVYALNSKKGDKNGISLEEWAWLLPKDKKEAKFVAQLLCDGGINKYGLSCAGLTENLLKDIEPAFGLATHAEVDEELAKLEKESEIEYPSHPYEVALFFSLISLFLSNLPIEFGRVLILKPYLCALFCIQKAFFFKFLVFFDRIIHKGLDRNPAPRGKIPIHFQILWL